jgi:hypothetical protein
MPVELSNKNIHPIEYGKSTHAIDIFQMKIALPTGSASEDYWSSA